MSIMRQSGCGFKAAGTRGPGGWPPDAAILRRDFLVSPERADRLSGTDRVAELRRRYPAQRLLLVLYGCAGLVDVATVESALA
jgi:hypothetical protein